MQAHFCSRVIGTHWKEIKKFYNSGKKEQIITLRPSPSSVVQCNRLNLPVSPIQLRVIRVELDSGETEILITSLMDTDLYPHEIFKELYRLRWTA